MKIKSFAPGKIILFGEHSVVHNRPAIAAAINRGVDVELTPRNDNIVHVVVPAIGYDEKHELTNSRLNYLIDSHKKMITDYIYEVINLFEFQNGFDIKVDINMYLGVGLGSSAAVTVSTLKAVSMYADKDYTKDELAGIARSIEIKIQGAASPIDTSMSTYGGIIYIDNEFKLHSVNVNMKLPLIVQNCQISGNTGKLVESVRQKYEKYPNIVGKIFDAMEQIAVDAKKALEEGNNEHLSNYMNLNQGLLDSIGVNTLELSEMVYTIRSHGAKGSKLTGSGGGGCIIAFCPDNIDEVYDSLDDNYPKFKCELSTEGVEASIIKD